MHWLVLAALLQATPDWENPEVFQRNREPPHASYTPYETPEEAVEGGASSLVFSLNGEWAFHWVPRPGSRPRDFFLEGYDASAWDTIRVPSNWELLGYGYPIYGSTRARIPS